MQAQIVQLAQLAQKNDKLAQKIDMLAQKIVKLAQLSQTNPEKWPVIRVGPETDGDGDGRIHGANGINGGSG